MTWGFRPQALNQLEALDAAVQASTAETPPQKFFSPLRANGVCTAKNV